MQPATSLQIELGLVTAGASTLTFGRNKMLTLQHKTSWILLAAGVFATLGVTAQYFAHNGNHAKVIQLYILPIAFEANPIPKRHVLLFPDYFSGAAIRFIFIFWPNV